MSTQQVPPIFGAPKKKEHKRRHASGGHRENEFDQMARSLAKYFGGQGMNQVGRVLDEAENKNVYQPKYTQAVTQDGVLARETVLLPPYHFHRNGELYEATLIDTLDTSDEIFKIFGIGAVGAGPGTTYVCSKADFNKAAQLMNLHRSETELYRPTVDKDPVVVKYLDYVREARRLESKLKDEIAEGGTNSTIAQAIRAKITLQNRAISDHYNGSTKSVKNKHILDHFFASNRGPDATLLKMAFKGDDYAPILAGSAPAGSSAFLPAMMGSTPTATS